MSVITISRGSYSQGKEIAEKLAQKLGYECLSRDIIIEASEHFNIPEAKLTRAIHDAPSIFDRFSYGKERYIAFIREALLEHIEKDNIVYHGFAGHFFLKEIPHVLKVRIIANIEDRVKEEMKRENISTEKARHILQKDDEERRKWSMYLYGIDTWDPKLYDVVLHIDKLKANDAVGILVDTVSRACFQTTSESQMMLKDLILAARVKTAVIDKFPTSNVSGKNGDIYISINAHLSQEENIIKKINKLVKNVEGVKSVKIHILPLMTADY